MAVSKQKPYNKHRQDTLNNIPSKNNQSRLSAQYTKSVRGTGISASVITDIDAMHLSIKK